MIQLEICNPERVLFSGEVSEVTVPGTEGAFTVFPGHIPLLSALEPGVVIFPDNRKVAVSTGFVKVEADKVSIAAHTAEIDSEIDLARARQQLEKYKAELTKVTPDEENFLEIEKKIKKWAVRVELSEPHA